MLIADDLKDLFVAFFRGIEKMEWEAIVVVATNIALVLFGFGALMISTSPLYLALAYAAASLFGVLLAGVIIFIHHVQDFLKSFNKDLIAPILRSAWPLALGGIAVLFSFNVDIIMLGFWRTADDVGIYAAVQKIVGVLGVIPALIGTSTFPIFSRLVHARNSVQMRQAMESIMRVLFLLAIPLILGGVVLGASLPEFIFGPAYGSGTNAMSILLLSILATFPIGIFTNLIFAYDKQRKMILYPLISSLVNIGLNFVLIPRLGMIGASLATLVSSLIYSFLMFRLCLKLETFSLWGGFSKIFSAAVPMAIFTWIAQLLGIPIFVNIILSTGLYFLILKFLKEDSLEDILSVIRPARS